MLFQIAVFFKSIQFEIFRNPMFQSLYDKNESYDTSHFFVQYLYLMNIMINLVKLSLSDQILALNWNFQIAEHILTCNLEKDNSLIPSAIFAKQNKSNLRNSGIKRLTL